MSAELLIHLRCDNNDSCEEKLVLPGDPTKRTAAEQKLAESWVTVVHKTETRHFCSPACAGKVLSRESSLVEVN